MSFVRTELWSSGRRGLGMSAMGSRRKVRLPAWEPSTQSPSTLSHIRGTKWRANKSQLLSVHFRDVDDGVIMWTSPKGVGALTLQPLIFCLWLQYALELHKVCSLAPTDQAVGVQSVIRVRVEKRNQRRSTMTVVRIE
jgi:hypothetical protein